MEIERLKTLIQVAFTPRIEENASRYDEAGWLFHWFLNNALDDEAGQRLFWQLTGYEIKKVAGGWIPGSDRRYWVFEVDGVMYRLDSDHSSWTKDDAYGLEFYEVEKKETTHVTVSYEGK